MTVGQLRALLERFPSNLNVLMSKDEEGNEILNTGEVTLQRYTFEGHELILGVHTWVDGMEEAGYSKEYVIDGPPCLVLWPSRDLGRIKELASSHDALREGN